MSPPPPPRDGEMPERQVRVNPVGASDACHVHPALRRHPRADCHDHRVVALVLASPDGTRFPTHRDNHYDRSQKRRRIQVVSQSGKLHG